MTVKDIFSLSGHRKMPLKMLNFEKMYQYCNPRLSTQSTMPGVPS